jgi:hypothetical protein
VLTLLPDGNKGNYFAETHRNGQRVQWQEQYFARTLTLAGAHSLKFGAEVDHTDLSGHFHFGPIEIRRADQTLSQRIDFIGPTDIDRPLTEFGGFVQDSWVVNSRITVDGGLRIDRNNISTQADVAPRVSVLLLPFKDDRTLIRGGVGIFYGRSPLSDRYFEAENLNDDDEPIGNPPSVIRSTSFPVRVVTTYAADGNTIVDGPRQYMNVIKGPWLDPRSIRWSLQLDRHVTKSLTVRAGYVHRLSKDEPIVVPKVMRNGQGLMVLKNRGTSQYDEVQLLAMYNSRRFSNWTVSYVRSKAEGSLNSADNFLSDFPAFVVRPNQYGPLPFDVPHRFLGYGEVKARYGITIMPALEIRSGFPYSVVNDRLEFVGPRNQARFPTFLSLDATILKSINVPFLEKKARVGAIIFNITNHFNPRDVQNNTASMQFGQFFNSLGTSVRAKFELDF